MSAQTFMALVVDIAAMLGGATVIATAVVAFLSRLLVERLSRASIEKHEKDLERLKRRYEIDLERHRLAFRKSEFLFEKQLEAANVFIRIRSKYIPLPWGPYLDHSDLMERIADNSGKIAKELSEFSDQFSAVLEKSDRNSISKLANNANELSFGMAVLTPKEHDNLAEQIISDLGLIEGNLIDCVRKQMST